MLLKGFLLSALFCAISAAPSQQKNTDDLTVAEGRSLPSYGSPVGYAPAPKYGSATVTSYNRRGAHVSQASDYAKPNIYGSSYGAQPSIRSQIYAPEPKAPQYASQSLNYPPAVEYGSYGPQTNAYSDQSKLISQDPAYDPAKDPVSQYASYVPVREYGPKGHSNGNELSIYGYRK